MNTEAINTNGTDCQHLTSPTHQLNWHDYRQFSSVNWKSTRMKEMPHKSGWKFALTLKTTLQITKV